MAADHHILRASLAAALAVAVGCDGGRADAPPAASVPAPAAPAVAAVRPDADAAWIDLAAPGEWPAGTVLLVGDTADPARTKALAVVAARPDGTASARIAAICDRTRPVAPGDPLRAAPAEPADPPPPAADGSDAARLAAERAALLDALAACARTRDEDDAVLAALHAEVTRLRRGEGRPMAALDQGARSRLAADLARVEAERAYFELASRVLRLEADPKALTALQDTVRRALEARADLAERKGGGHD